MFRRVCSATLLLLVAVEATAGQTAPPDLSDLPLAQ